MEMEIPVGLIEAASVAGRWLFGALFLVAGFGHFKNRENATAYAKGLGVPVPAVAVVASGLVFVGGAAAVITGYGADIAALLIAATLIPTTFFFHKPEGQEQTTNMLKNVSLIGAALTVFVADVSGLLNTWAVDAGLFSIG